jgi:single-strand DNA-binding protein
MKNLKNTVNIIGRTGIDPIIRTFENGVKLAKFSVATNETIIEANGKKVKTQWHNIVAWGKKAELIEKFVKQGQLMSIEGKLINRIFKDNTGGNKRITEIQVSEILLINPKPVSADIHTEVKTLPKRNKVNRDSKKAS